MKSVRLLLINGQELIHCGVQGLLELKEEMVQGMLEMEDDMEIVGDYSSAEEALRQPEILSPNIVLMEARMSGMDRIEITRRLHQKWASCKVIMLTWREDCLTEALEAGVVGYLLKDITCQELVQAIRRAYHGELVIDERLTPTQQAAEGEPEGDGSDTMAREVELVIPPPAEAALLLRFACQVEEALGATIMQAIGSWKNGFAITIAPQRTTPLMTILDRLEKMPEVEGVKEEPAARYNPFSFSKKIMTKLETRPEKQLLVTLKQTSTAKQLESAGLGVS